MQRAPRPPLDFPEPVLRQGQRIKVDFVNPEKRGVQRGKVLLACAHHNDTVERGYLQVPRKKPISTGLGSVYFCHVLTREACKSNRSFELTDEIIVVKKCKKRHFFTRSPDDARKEAAAMQLVGKSLPNVTELLDVLEDTSNKSLNLVLPYYPNGSLQDLYASKTYKPSEKIFQNHFRDVMEGLNQLHSKGVCHRDISIDNVMLDEKNKCVLIDLGASIRMPSDNFGQRIPITPQAMAGKMGYMSPEIYNEGVFDGEKVDVWSAGVILYLMLTNIGSYDYPRESDMHYKVMTDRELVSKYLKQNGVKKLSDQAMDLIHGMLEKDPSNRLTVEKVQKHPWLDN